MEHTTILGRMATSTPPPWLIGVLVPAKGPQATACWSAPVLIPIPTLFRRLLVLDLEQLALVLLPVLASEREAIHIPMATSTTPRWQALVQLFL